MGISHVDSASDADATTVPLEMQVSLEEDGVCGTVKTETGKHNRDRSLGSGQAGDKTTPCRRQKKRKENDEKKPISAGQGAHPKAFTRRKCRGVCQDSMIMQEEQNKENRVHMSKLSTLKMAGSVPSAVFCTPLMRWSSELLAR